MRQGLTSLEAVSCSLLCAYTGLSALQASGNSPASNSHLNIRALG